MRFYTAILVALLLLISTSVPAYAASGDITLTAFRAVRISATSITLSFISDQQSIGKIEYTDIDESKVTLTDSVPQIDHLFTIEDLDPSRGYAFTVSAQEGKDISYEYRLLIAPETIGELGQSIVPPIDIVDTDGNHLGSVPSSSTTDDAVYTPPVWPFGVTAFGIIGGYWLYLYAKRRLVKRDETIRTGGF